MLEALLVISIVYAIMLWPYRGKSFHELTPKQQAGVVKRRDAYLKTRKGKQTPQMSVDEYLPVIQKQALTYLILAIVILPIYIVVLITIYPSLMGF